MNHYLTRNESKYKKRGLGLWFQRGCTGTEYGDPRRNEFLYVDLLFLLWHYSLRFSWKGKVNE